MLKLYVHLLRPSYRI